MPALGRGLAPLGSVLRAAMGRVRAPWAWVWAVLARDELIVDLATCVFADRDGVITSVRAQRCHPVVCAKMSQHSKWSLRTSSNTSYPHSRIRTEELNPLPLEHNPKRFKTSFSVGINLSARHN